MINLPPNAEVMIENSGRARPSWMQWFVRVYLACFAVYDSGTTANRPTKDLWIGRPYFDVTLNRPIWWTGSNWIKADGTIV